MIRRSVQRARRVVVARMLAAGASVNAIAKHLGIGWESANREVQYVKARQDTAEYMTAERALVVTVARLAALEDVALGHVKLAAELGEHRLARRWFESARRVARARGRLLAEAGALRGDAGGSPDLRTELPALELSARALELQARIARAEQLGQTWEVRVTFDVPEALEPIPDRWPVSPELPTGTEVPDDEEPADPK